MSEIRPPQRGYYWIEQNYFVADDYITVAHFDKDGRWYFLGWGNDRAMTHDEFLAKGMVILSPIAEPTIPNSPR